MRAIAKAADAISAGDKFNTSIRRYQNWGLMPAQVTVGTVMPATYMRGNRESLHPGEPNFPRCAGLFWREASLLWNP